MNVLPAPPEPRLSRIQQTARFMKDPFGLLAQTRAECGDVFSLNLLGMGRWVFLCNAAALNELYRFPEDRVVAGEIRNKILAYLFGSRASVSLDGPEYADRRRAMIPHFGGRRVFQHAGLIHQLTEEKLVRWPIGKAFPLQPYLNDISVETAARVLFGPLDEEPAAQLLPLARQFLIALQPTAVQARPLQWNLGRFSPYGRFLIARNELYAALDSTIRVLHRRRAAEATATEPEDVLSALVAAELYEDEGDCREAIVHEMAALAVGGSETTSKGLAWTLVGVLSDRRIFDRLRHELDEVLGDRPIRPEDFRQLPYLHAVIQEGLRFQSIGPFAGPRLAKTDIEIGGFRIAAGTPIGQCLQEVGRSDVFPNPEQFDPENFLDHKIKTSDWVPFGGGSRLCTGMGLAQLELAIVTGTLVQRLELELAAGSTGPVRRGIAFQPANGLKVIVRDRRPGSKARQ